MPAQLPSALSAKIDQLLLRKIAQIKSGECPLRFIGATQDARWRRDAAQTIDTAFQMFLPDIMADPIMDQALVQTIMREVHLVGLRTAQQIPIKDFLDRLADAAGVHEPPPQPPSAQQTDLQQPDSQQPGPVSRLRRTQSTSRIAPPWAERGLRRTASVSLRRPTSGLQGGISLKPMLDLMKHGIIKRHPAIVEFLHAVVQTVQSLDSHTRFAYLQYVRDSLSLKKTVYLTYILDILIVSMTNSKEFAFEVQSHFYKELQRKGIDPFDTFATFRGIMALPNSTLFKGAKTISVFPAMTMYIARRFNNGTPPSNQQIAALSGFLSWADRKALQICQEVRQGGEDTGLLINMEEAVIADFSAGRRDNAAVGAIYCSRLYGVPAGVGAANGAGVVSSFPTGWVFPIGLQSTDGPGVSHPFYEAVMVDIRKKERIRINGQPMLKNYHASSYDDDWASLYHTWNMAFILGEIPDLDIIAPKLLAPSVMCAKGEQYLFCRLHGLFTAICFMILKCSDGVQMDIHPPNHQALARLYGAINLEQAWLYQVRRKGAAAGSKDAFLTYWDNNAPSLVGGALGYARLAAHAFLGWTSRLTD
jgi:hypothetical protein